ncbi:MAG: ATP-binding cassette domain-containing protein [candidate division Zixibacteria bacterium]|nr:ATP-binding cassette domain-containing protein [candidate division Zixibacteria bacterium]
MISLKDVSYKVESEDGDPVEILSNVNLVIKRGEKVALMGANGTGKTTLARLLAGVLTPSSGTVEIEYQNTSNPEFRKNLGRKVGLLFQNPDHQIVSVNVERELALGPENYGYSSDEIHAMIQEYMDRYSLEAVLKSHPHKLSGGEKRRLGLASVMILEPDILILDEPMAHLDMVGRMLFKEELNKILQDDFMTLIYITQNLEEVLDFDRLVVMNGGHIRKASSVAEALNEGKDLEKYGIEFPIRLEFEKDNSIDRQVIKDKIRSLDLEKKSNEESKIVLECNYISFGWKGRNRIISDLNLKLFAGKVHGLLGPTGCGKTTLALLLGGLIEPENGRIELNGVNANQSDLIRDVSYIFQNPERGMFAETVFEDIAYGPKNFGYSGGSLSEAVKNAFNLVGLDIDRFKDRSPHTLSGGEARLAAIAGGIASNKNIIIMDEPTEELDLMGRKRIKAIVEKSAHDGKTVFLISHDSDFLFEVCDYLMIWRDSAIDFHKKIDLYGSPDIFENAQVEMPKILQFANRLQLMPDFMAAGISTLSDLHSILPPKN